MQTTKNRAPKRVASRFELPTGAAHCAGLQPSHRPGRRALPLETTLQIVATLMAILVLTGCGPPGPRAVLEGKRLLERGEYAQAIEELRNAVELMPTNALAFNYLGLAFHQAGQVPEAERAYLRALALNHDLTEVHYDLGCLWLNPANKPEQAKAELISYTLRRPNSPEGWLKLGEAQLRTHELAAAEKSFSEALRLDPQNPEGLTEMGLVRLQHRRANEAAQFFSKALKEQPDYRPALLNLAIVAQQDLNAPQLALQKYREYIALKPAPENVQAVSVLVRQLEQELKPPQREAPTNSFTLAPATNAPKVAPPEPVHTAVQKAPATNVAHTPPIAKPDLATNGAKSANTAAVPKPTAPTNPPPPERVELVKVSAEPVIKPAEDLSAPTTGLPPETNAVPESSSNTPAQLEAKTQKRSFFQRINPVNLFTRDGKPSTDSAPLMASAANPSVESSTIASNGSTVPPSEPRKVPRYLYRSPEKPLAGDRDLAQRAFSQGVQEQQARHFAEAIQAYRHAALLDPSFYDAHYNLGLAAFQNGNLPLALAADETALAIEPESLDARYNFGLVLKQAGYVVDAVNEFEKILAKYPNDGRTHLALGNLYAQQLQEPAKAREHYLAVLAVAPQSPQAGAIRYWLTDHPK